MTFVSVFSIFFGRDFTRPFLLLSQDRAMDTGGSGTPQPRPPPCSPRPPTAPSTSPSCLSGSTGPTVRDSILVIRRSVLVHCKNTIPKIRNKYSQKMNCVATVPISTFTFPRSICLFCCRKIFGPILGIYKSLTDT
jgi:hypothetical protein